MTVAAGTAWLVYACRTPYTTEVAEILWRGGDTIAALVDNLPDGPVASDLASVFVPADLDAASSTRPTVIPLLTPGHRFTVHAEAVAAGLRSFPALVDPTAVVARTSTLGEGTVVNAMAVVGATSQLGRFVHVNRSASIGHDADVHDFATLGPACVLAGHVTIGVGAFVGAGAVLAPKVRIGANAIVGAGAVVVRDVAAGAVVVGNPAKVLRVDDVGYGGVAVPATEG